MRTASKEFRKTVNPQAEYQKFNHQFFDGQLPKIEIRWSLSKTTGGTTRATVVRATGEASNISITLSTFYMMDKQRFDMILLHEMIHVWCFVNKLDREKGGGHGSNFVKKAAEISSKVGFKIPLTDSHSLDVSEDVPDVIVVENKRFFIVVKEKDWHKYENLFLAYFSKSLDSFGESTVYKTRQPNMVRLKTSVPHKLTRYSTGGGFDKSIAKKLMTIDKPLDVKIDAKDILEPYVKILSNTIEKIFKVGSVVRWLASNQVAIITTDNGAENYFQIAIGDKSVVGSFVIDGEEKFKEQLSSPRKTEIVNFVKWTSLRMGLRDFAKAFSAPVTANSRDVIKRIFKKVPDKNQAMEMAMKVDDYARTKDDKKDLSPGEQRFLYRDVDLGEELPVTKKRKVNVQWSDHAEYRSELRDIDPKKVNEQVRDRIVDKLNPPQHKDMRFKEPGLGTFVVDFDTTKNPVDADVITVWGSISRRNLI